MKVETIKSVFTQPVVELVEWRIAESGVSDSNPWLDSYF